MTTYALIDLSVFMHMLAERKRDYDRKTEAQAVGIKQAQLAWLLSCDFLAGYVPAGEPVYPILLRDQKAGVAGYWIHQYLKRPDVYNRIPRYGKKIDAKTGQASRLKSQPVAYKGHRGPSQPSYVSLVNMMDERLIRLGVPQLKATGYEADSWLGAVCALNSDKPPEGRDRFIIVTTDSDHMGAVCREVSWFCMTGHRPRVRDNMVPINEWAQRRLKVTLKTPRELWEVKAAQGDKSDNLPPGSPIEVIDLLAPPAEFDLTRQYDKRLKIKEALDAKWLIGAQEGQRAARYLRQMAVRPYPKPFDPSQDIYL